MNGGSGNFEENNLCLNSAKSLEVVEELIGSGVECGESENRNVAHRTVMHLSSKTNKTKWTKNDPKFSGLETAGLGRYSFTFKSGRFLVIRSST